jgi:CDP-glycerol glycerophosphotransferase (TagB/SpsB family)
LCCGKEAQKQRSEAWEITAEKLPLVGMPRLDFMFSHRDCIKIMYPQHAGKKLILAMETFKVSKRYIDAPESDDRYALNVITSEDELRELDAFVAKQNAILVIKTHRLQDMSYIEKMNLQNILFLNDDELQEKGVQLNEFLENASLLLTDYSSVFYDYLLVNRPIGFMVGDIEEYTRGFIFDDPFSEMPGQKIQNLEELTTFIADSFEGKDSFEEERMAIKARVFVHPDAKNCERLLNWLTEQHILPSATSTSN